MIGSGSPVAELPVMESFTETVPAAMATLGFAALTFKEAGTLAAKFNRALIKDAHRPMDEVDWPTHGEVLGAFLALVCERAEGVTV